MAGLEARWWFAQPGGVDLKWHYNWFNYHADADWNLRADFMNPVSFNQDGSGIDDRWSHNLLARLNKSWNMELSHSFRYVTFLYGQDVLYLANGAQEYTLGNEMVWFSGNTALTFTCAF